MTWSTRNLYAFLKKATSASLRWLMFAGCYTVNSDVGLRMEFCSLIIKLTEIAYVLYK